MAKKNYVSPVVDLVQFCGDVITFSVQDQDENFGGFQDNIYDLSDI